MICHDRLPWSVATGWWISVGPREYGGRIGCGWEWEWGGWPLCLNVRLGFSLPTGSTHMAESSYHHLWPEQPVLEGVEMMRLGVVTSVLISPGCQQNICHHHQEKDSTWERAEWANSKVEVHQGKTTIVICCRLCLALHRHHHKHLQLYQEYSMK